MQMRSYFAISLLLIAAAALGDAATTKHVQHHHLRIHEKHHPDFDRIANRSLAVDVAGAEASVRSLANRPGAAFAPGKAGGAAPTRARVVANVRKNALGRITRPGRAASAQPRRDLVDK